MVKDKGPDPHWKTFGEVVSHLGLSNFSDTQWDQVFHNWESPVECHGREHVTGCTVCEHLIKHGFVVRTGDNKKFTNKPKK